MEMWQDGIEVYCLPNGARCELDLEGRSPLEMEDCPLGKDYCSGDCLLYTEQNRYFENRSEINDSFMPLPVDGYYLQTMAFFCRWS